MLEIEDTQTVTGEDGCSVQELVLNIGPSHPATHGVGRLVARLDGEIVVWADMVVGYLHRGIEKMAENRTYLQVIPLTDRLDYTGSMYSNWAYCRALERLAGIQVPERGEYLRVITCELQRLASHMVAIGATAGDTGAATFFMYGFQQRELILDLFERLCGARLTYNYVRPGGVSRDIPDDAWAEDVRTFCDGFVKQLKDMDALFFDNYIAKRRLKGIGVLDPARAVAAGVTGSVARASGVDWDLRKNDAYSLYERFEFDVPLGEHGDVYDRARVRLLECYEAVRIIQQALDQIPGGPVIDETLPRLITPRTGEAYDHIESARGSLGVYLVSDGSPRPYRMKVRSPAFSNISVAPELAVGHTLSELALVLGSLDPCFGEVDR